MPLLMRAQNESMKIRNLMQRVLKNLKKSNLFFLTKMQNFKICNRN